MPPDYAALDLERGREVHSATRRRDNTRRPGRRRDFRRVALIVARMTGKRVGVDTATRMLEE